MFRLNLKIAIRNLWKNKGYTLINVLGLSIGMAGCILIFIFIHFQLSFDQNFKNGDRIFRFVTDWKYNSFDDYSSGVPIPFTAAARNEIAGLEKVGAIAKLDGIIRVKDDHGNEIMKLQEDIYYAEPDFFDAFNIDWLYGKSSQTLKEPNTVTLSQATAVRFFGSSQNAIGKILNLDAKTNLKVTGVFQDLSENSSFPLKIVISYQTFELKDNTCWSCVNSNFSSYALLKEGADPKDITTSLAQFNKKYYASKNIQGNQVNKIQPVADIHFNELYDNFSNKTISKSQLYSLGIIGLFLIFTACINFINLNTAQAISRSKEVGVRKVMGSKRKQLIVQFLTETFAIVLVAIIFACILSELAIPAMQNLFKDQVSFSLFGHPVIFLFMLLLVVFVSFLAGLYPALIISGFNPVLAIKNKVLQNNKGLSLRKALVVLQFTITIILIIGTIVIVHQTEYIRQKPLGFNTKETVMVGVPGDKLSKSRFETFKEKVLQIPGVQQFSYCQSAPLSQDVSSTAFTFNGSENTNFEVRIYNAEQDYFKLFDLKIIAGKVYAKSDTANGYVVNETFLKKVNVNSPQEAIGKMIEANGVNLPIVGVVKDFNDKSLKENISGLIISSNKNQYWKAAIKIEASQMLPVMDKIEKLWNNNFPEGIYNSTFVNDKINSYYEHEKITGQLFKVFATVVIFISFIGLFGLISFVANQRTKELAIRKVLGATTLQVMQQLNRSFLIMVFVANLIAWPLAYLMVKKWLSGFAYQIQLNAWPFIISMLVTLFLTFIIVSFKSYRAAMSNTIDALKYE